MVNREAVRALLLIKIVEPVSKRAFWLTPGGGIDRGETSAAGLRREVFEETGLREFEVGLEVWRREHRFTWAGQRIVQRERFYLVRVERFEPTAHYLPDRVEQDTFGEFRWWAIEDIEPSSEAFAPRRLGVLLRSLIQNGPPVDPIVLTD